MADTLKVVESTPSATTVTDIYTAASAAVVTLVRVCNTSNTVTTYRMSVAIAGAGDAIGQYFVYERPINGYDTHEYAAPMNLASTDKIRAYVGNNTVNFFVHTLET